MGRSLLVLASLADDAVVSAAPAYPTATPCGIAAWTMLARVTCMC